MTAYSPQTWRFCRDWATNFPIFGCDKLTALLNVHVCLQDDIVVYRMKCVCGVIVQVQDRWLCDANNERMDAEGHWH